MSLYPSLFAPSISNKLITSFPLVANRLGYKDTFIGFYYYIECGAICSSDECPTHSKIFTLEEFLVKYPYIIGDRVLSYNKWIGVIESMEWYRGEVLYHIRECDNCISSETVEHLQYYKDTKVTNKAEIMKKNQLPKTQAEVDKYLKEHPIKNGMNVIDIETCLETDGLKLSENVVINSKGIDSIQFIQWYEKSQYPKTYKECCNLLGIEDRENGYCGYEYELLGEFQKLYICRNAYWKIAGDWKPEFRFGKKKYCIMTKDNKVISATVEETNRLLTFPTEEMRHEFYENFKDLIEQCKELL